MIQKQEIDTNVLPIQNILLFFQEKQIGYSISIDELYDILLPGGYITFPKLSLVNEQLQKKGKKIDIREKDVVLLSIFNNNNKPIKENKKTAKEVVDNISINPVFAPYAVSDSQAKQIDIMRFANILQDMNLYEKYYFEDVWAQFPSFDSSHLYVDELNNILHLKNKEVTSLNDYYILVQPGIHEDRQKFNENLNNNYRNRINMTNPAYRNDLSRGAMHISRDEQGRASSNSVEDFYD